MITSQLRNLEQELTLQTHSYLEVHKKASNMASRAELGKYPMIISINKKIFNHLSYRQDQDNKSLQISVELYKSGQNSSHSNLMKISEYFNLFDFNYSSLSDSKIKQLVDLMKKKYVSCWNKTSQHSRKLRFYHSNKENYSLLLTLTQQEKVPREELS